MFVILRSIFLWATFLQVATSGLSPPGVHQKPIPITVLSGFLGSGKTSLLQNLLQNREGLRIAVIVNDVASINIDSKLIASSRDSTKGASGMIELENGCACCSLSEELLASVSELVVLSDMKADDEGFHHIVVELSGVADPKSVRAKFQEAILYDMPLMERVRLDTMVTVIDCSVFLDYLASARLASPDETPELFYRDGEEPPKDDDADWMDDLPLPIAQALFENKRILSGVDNSVAELMVQQTETSDIVLLNKVDLVEGTSSNNNDGEIVNQIQEVVKALNPRATIYETKYGKIKVEHILGAAEGKGVVEAGVVDDHRDALAAAQKEQKSRRQHSNDQSDHDSGHQSHDHSEHQSHGRSEQQSHDHSHSREHSHDHEGTIGNDSDGTETNHSHSNSQANAECTDQDCTDHSHSHAHAPNHAGIDSFVYQARRPFHPRRLTAFLKRLPIVRGLPETLEEEIHSDEKDNQPLALDRILKKVLRSKGFAWCADSNVAALYWSHAGSSFEMQCLGRWWATLPREQWPPEAVSMILADFDDADHSEESAATSVGDRRQEVVFIGQGLGDSSSQNSLREELDSCLLDNEEWNSFLAQRENEDKLRSTFSNPMNVQMAGY